MLVLDGLSRTFGKPGGKPGGKGGLAVSGLSVSIPRGQFVGVIGRSGAGKSTTLRMINRLTEPTAGRITYDGTDVTALRGRALRDWRRRCATVFQQFNLAPRLDVLTNVLVGRLCFSPGWRSMTGLWRPADRDAAMAALDSLGLADLAAQRAETLSGGQQQRVAICRALVQEPDLVLADEPVASLDPRNAQLVMDALQRLNRHFGLTVVCNLHSLDLARQYCDRLLGLSAGHLVLDIPAAELTDAAARGLYGLDPGADASTPSHPAAPLSAAVVPA